MDLDAPVLAESNGSDTDTDDEEAMLEDEQEELVLDIGNVRKNAGKGGLGALQAGQLLQMVLQDAQTRLFFKAQSVIQSEIRHYQPKPEDIAYPQKLLGKISCSSFTITIADIRSDSQKFGSVPLKEKETISDIFKTASLDRRETWYPTLTSTERVLSQLHDYVQV
jgi:conserved oligomeric Golgi complex subunit 3